ncbi:MAG: hypothetical protein H0T60_10280 [Acidobacteria bacterium]|nr:hypothetical protein [Acidobacteriota bacterium]
MTNEELQLERRRELISKFYPHRRLSAARQSREDKSAPSRMDRINKVAKHWTVPQGENPVKRPKGKPRGTYTGPSIPLEVIARTVEEYFDITRTELLARRNAPTITRPRMIAMYLCTKRTIKSLPQIGLFFAGRDHTTVMNAMARVDLLMDADPEIAGMVREIDNIITTSARDKALRLLEARRLALLDEVDASSI